MINGRKQDITRNGEISCALFVSSLLVLFRLAEEAHATVGGTIKDMRKFGWTEIKKPKAGCIIVWEAADAGKGGAHRHIGFYIGNSQAVSNSSTRRFPVKHHWTFHGKRKIDAMLWHKKLAQS